MKNITEKLKGIFYFVRIFIEIQYFQKNYVNFAMKSKSYKTYIISLSLTLCVTANSLASSVKASTFGWNATNATTAFVNAIKSANDTIVIDLQESDWMISPTSFDKLKNKTIVFENGVNLVARPGAFSSIFDASLMVFYEAYNVKIIGYGATFRMQKAEYIAYNNSQHRHCISLISCSNVSIYGLKLMDSGGDGIIVASYNGQAYQRYCENVLLKDLWCDNNYRQGISVISAQHLRVENCWFTNTNGTAPQAGVDIEPNKPFERLIDIVFEKCRFTGNVGGGIKVIPISMDSTTLPMDITFNNCFVGNNGINRYQIETYSYPSGAKGYVRYNNCMTEGGSYSVGGSKLVNGHKTIFNNCVFRNPTDIVINLDDYTTSGSGIRNGGISFTNCSAFYNTTKRFFNVWRANTSSAGLDDVQFNNFTVINPNTVTYNDGGKTTANCVFDFQKFTTAPTTNVTFDVSDNLIECNNTHSLLKATRDASSNISYPLGIGYTVRGYGVSGADYSRPSFFEIIPKGSYSVTDTLFVLSDNITEPTKYDSLFINTNADFSTNYLPQRISIKDFVLPNLTVNDATICDGQSVTLIASGAPNYFWSTNEMTSSINVSPRVTTSYSVSGSIGVGCPSITVNTQVVVKPLPIVTVDSAVICNGQSATLTASGADDYHWSNNETTDNITVSPTVSTLYSVIGMRDGCASTMINTQVIVKPTPAVTVDSAIICQGQSATLTAIGALNYVWSNNDIGSSIIVSPAQTAEYSVIGSIDGCESKAISAKVTVNPLPLITLGPDTILQQGQEIVLHAFNDGSSYKWSTGATTASIAVNTMGIYVVTVTNEFNCVASDTIMVSIVTSIDELRLYAIVVFPNPTQDVLTIKSKAPLSSIEVINVMGKVVLKETELVNNNNLVLDLSALPSGVYSIRVKGNAFLKTVQVVKI